MTGSAVYYDFAREMDQVAIILQTDADLVADRLELSIKRMMAAGMGPNEIIATLRRDLRTGGPLFSGFASTFRHTVFPLIDNVAQGAVTEANPAAARWEWITTSAEPCPDCSPRHGQVKTFEEWERAGLPRSGFSVCGDNCKCALVPEGQAGETISAGPVKIPTLAEARSGFKSRLQSDPELRSRMDAYRASLRAREN